MKKAIIIDEPIHKSEMMEAIQHNSTNPTLVESVECRNWKERNAENKKVSRRGWIDTTHSGGTITNNAVPIGRNEPCHCGSKKKFKNCHLVKQIIQKQ